jgi:Carboxypeptidase regulatory-like domain/TonB dependent receptor-like, beta-barrel/TonB-dependent Receptor Plug Domain
MLVRKFQRKVSMLMPMFFAIGAFFASHAYAQISGATLSGTVTDQSGAVVPQATITIKNVATGITRSNTTSAAGYYSAPNLLPGIYEIKAEAQGFTSKIQPGVNLTVGEQQVLNFTLQVGQMSTVVEVNTEAPNVDLASSTISAVVSSTTVRELPLNGRSWTDLATLQPGVNSIQTQPDFTAGPDRGKRGFGNQLTIDGARPQQNNYRLDGISTNDYDNAAPGSVLGGDLGVDAIQEFSVLTSNYSADYGRTAGGVVNAITRSGTNQLHGSVYEFLRNDALDAANFFENAGGIPKASFRQNQFGVAAGGPIRKDKLFVFGDYEALRYSKGIPTLITVPSDAARLGILLDSNGNLEDLHGCGFQGWTQANGCPTSGTPTAPLNSQSQCATEGNGAINHLLASGRAGFCVDDNAASYLRFWHGATSTPAGSNLGSFTFSAPRVVSENFETVRVDDKLSDKDSLAATYLGDITPYSAPDQLDAVLLNSRTNRQIGILEETHIFNSSVTNSARFGFSRDAARNNVGLTAINSLAKDPSLAAVLGQFAAQVNVSSLNSFTGGIGANGPGLFRWNSFQGYDDAFWTHGTHTIKFGAAVERMQLNMDQLSESSGTFTFKTLSDFLTNQPHKFTLAQSANPTEGLRQTLFGVYIQDDWRARPNLTLNLGLRWEMTTVPTEVQGKLATLFNLYTDVLPHCAAIVTGNCAGGGPLLPNPTLHNFDPRVGFAWDPFHNGKTAVRGGFGIFDVLPLISVSFPATTVAPFQTTGFLQKSPNLPGSFFTKAAGLLSGTTQEASYYDRQPHRSYDMQWNLNVQRELAPNLTVLVGYVGSRAVHLGLANNDRDIVIPMLTSAGYLFPNPVGNGSVLNGNFGDISGITYNGRSYYNALEVGVQKTMSHGLAVHSSFTWGKSIDVGSAGGAGDQFSNSIGAPPWYDLKSIRGLSDFNIGRTLVVTLTWQVPSPKSWSGAAGWITSGWELGGIYKVSDGVPFTPTFGTDGDPQGLNSSDTWDFPNRLSGPGCQSLVNPGNPNNYIKTECFAIPTAPCPPGSTDASTCPFYNGSGSNGIGCDPTPFTDSAGNPVPVPFPQCFNLRGNSGRNILIGPGTSNLDFSIFKNIPIKKISESFNVQFRSEFFNILNHPNFAVPVTPDHTDIFDSTGSPTGVAGKLTSTSTTGREIQFALKLLW